MRYINPHYITLPKSGTVRSTHPWEPSGGRGPFP